MIEAMSRKTILMDTPEHVTWKKVKSVLISRIANRVSTPWNSRAISVTDAAALLPDVGIDRGDAYTRNEYRFLDPHHNACRFRPCRRKGIAE